MGPFYRLCPKEKKSKYQSSVMAAIRHAEAVMLIEHQLLRNEIQRHPQHNIQASAHAHLCMSTLRTIQELYDGPIVENVINAVDNVFVYLANHVQNVRTFTSIF